jgi:hypothetical protein
MMGIWPARTHGREAWEDLGEDGADRRASSISDGGVVTAGNPARAWRWDVAL